MAACSFSVINPTARCQVVHHVMLTVRPKPDLPRVSQIGRHAIRRVFQVSDRRYLQEIEIIFAGITKAGITKIDDVAIEGRAPSIVLADVAVKQQVVPPSERTGAFYGLRSPGHLPKVRERLMSRFVPRISQM